MSIRDTISLRGRPLAVHPLTVAACAVAAGSPGGLPRTPSGVRDGMRRWGRSSLGRRFFPYEANLRKISPANAEIRDRIRLCGNPAPRRAKMANSPKKWPLLVSLAACLDLAALAPLAAHADFTSADVAAATASAHCVDWRVKGICLRLKCGFFGCKVISVPWVRHRIPDLVVSAYNAPGEIPWTEVRTVLGRPLASAASALSQTLIGAPLGGGHATAGRPSLIPEGRKTTGNRRYKEVSVIGNPVTAAFREWMLDAFPLICPTEVEPLVPYFQSEADAAAWRTGLAEQFYPASWTPGLRSIGEFPRIWGTVFPRQGHVHQHHDVLAGAVAAQRAVDVATRPDQPHVYRQVPGIQESDEKTDFWQMIHPKRDDSCQAFGIDPDYFEGRENGSGDDEGGYGWVYWPQHDCCPGPGWLISRIEF